jgi:hypothetical protein
MAGVGPGIVALVKLVHDRLLARVELTGRFIDAPATDR